MYDYLYDKWDFQIHRICFINSKLLGEPTSYLSLKKNKKKKKLRAVDNRKFFFSRFFNDQRWGWLFRLIINDMNRLGPERNGLQVDREYALKESNEA